MRIITRWSFSKLFLVTACSTAAFAYLQLPAQRPQFETASIKPSNSADRRLFFNMNPELYRVSNITVKRLIQQAYGIKAFQLEGGPGWAGSDLFDISAKPEAPANGDQLKLMLQSLLADRFQLAVRRETRQMPVYGLVVAKNGPKLKEPAVPAPNPADGSPRAPVRITIRRGLLDAPVATTAGLADLLSDFLGVKVENQTGLTGAYAMRLEWQPDENQVAMFQGMGVPEGFGAPPPDPLGPSLFAALQEQLGLRLESQKGPVDMLVIERVERPSAN